MRELILLLCMVGTVPALAQRGTIAKVVSTASGAATVAPDSLVSIYGSNLADRSEAAAALPLPAQLGGIAVVVQGPTQSVNAPLVYASPTQINFLLPAGTPAGNVTIRVVGPEIIIASATAEVQSVAPALFSANSTGSGVAAAVGLRVVIPTRIQSTVPVFTCDATASCKPVALDVGVDAPVYLEFFGTGIRGGANTTVTVGGKTVPVDYAGAQPQFPGLDQVNIPLQLNLRGAGLVDVVVAVDGKASNPVQILIQ